MHDTNNTPALGAAGLGRVSNPWKGYPRAALFRAARAVRDDVGVTFTEALDIVVRHYVRTGEPLTPADAVAYVRDLNDPYPDMPGPDDPRWTKPAPNVRRVEIPATPQHDGFSRVTVAVVWNCPTCGAPRGEVFRTHSFDGSRRMSVDGWKNPCGHIDKYHAVLSEAASNGLN